MTEYAHSKTRRAAIIGAGPGGITTAIQLKRSGFSPLLFERDRPGGLLLNANLVENYPGFPRGITGEKLVRSMVRQLERIGVEIVPVEVRNVRRDGAGFLLDTVEGQFRSESVVVATGTRGIVPDDLPIPSSLLGDYIYTELKDIPSEPGDHLAVVGGGDCAFDYALNLAGRSCRVSILHRGNRPRALPVLVDRVRAHPNITYVPGVVVGDLERGSGGLILFLKGEGEEVLEVDLLVLAVGRTPEDALLSPGMKAELDSGKRIRNLYLVGDVGRGLMRQVGIAVGDGLAAAMDINRKMRR